MNFLTKIHKLLESLKNPSWNRLFHIYDALKLGLPFNTVQDLTKIDKWFLNQINELVLLEREAQNYELDTCLSRSKTIALIDADTFKEEIFPFIGIVDKKSHLSKKY